MSIKYPKTAFSETGNPFDPPYLHHLRISIITVFSLGDARFLFSGTGMESVLLWVANALY
jgi:hypothetical protein